MSVKEITDEIVNTLPDHRDYLRPALGRLVLAVDSAGTGPRAKYGKGVSKVASSGDKEFWVLTAFGETKFAKEWAKDPRCQVSHEGLLARVKKGMGAVPAITLPADPHPKSLGAREKWNLLSEKQLACVKAKATVKGRAAAVSVPGTTRGQFHHVLRHAKDKLGCASVSELVLKWQREHREESDGPHLTSQDA